MGIEHDEVQPLFAIFVMDGRDQHTAGVDAHHRPGRQVCDGQKRLSDQLFGLVIHMDARKDGAILACAVIQRELEQLLGLLDSHTVLDLYGAEIALGEGLEIDMIFKERLDLDVGEVDLLFGSRGFLCLCSLRPIVDDFDLLSVAAQRLHCGDKIPHME